jgi:micrococcal nuclease
MGKFIDILKEGWAEYIASLVRIYPDVMPVDESHGVIDDDDPLDAREFLQENSGIDYDAFVEEILSDDFDLDDDLDPDDDWFTGELDLDFDDDDTFDEEDDTMMDDELTLPTYTYKATLIKVIDGDTIDVLLDAGLYISVRKRLRLLDIDAYEKRGEERELGLLATDRITELVEGCSEMLVQTVMDTTGKYGRLLAKVWTRAPLADDFVYVNRLMVLEGHAVPYE